jgi:hypothetical protein
MRDCADENRRRSPAWAMSVSSLIGPMHGIVAGAGVPTVPQQLVGHLSGNSNPIYERAVS